MVDGGTATGGPWLSDWITMAPRSISQLTPVAILSTSPGISRKQHIVQAAIASNLKLAQNEMSNMDQDSWILKSCQLL